MKSLPEKGQMLQLFSNGRLFLLTLQSILYQHIHVCIHATCLDHSKYDYCKRRVPVYEKVKKQ